MKSLLSGLLLGCGAVLAAGEVFRCEFSPAELKKWSMPPEAACMRKGGFNFVRFTVPEAKKSGQNLMTIPFDIAACRGRTLRVSCRIRADKVSVPPQAFNGVKLMVSFRGTTPEWMNLARVWGSFDWREESFSFQVPDNAVNGKLYLGLQDSSGVVDFARLKAEVLDVADLFPPVAELPENFRAEYTPLVTSTPVLRGAMSPGEYRKGDLDVLASWGANLVRWQMTRNWGGIRVGSDLEEYNRWLDGELDEFESALADCERLGMKVILDLHAPPGGINEAHETTMLYEEKYAKAFSEVWRKIAARFKGRTGAIFGYNLVNEPVQKGKAPFNYLRLQYEAAQAIREVDPDIPIIIESNLASAPSTFAYLTPLPLKDVIYQVHMYRPLNYTHQGLELKEPIAYPGVNNGVMYDREKLKEILEPVREFQRKYGARIYVGEFAATRWAEGADRYMSDCISIFEEYGWDWSYHAFRESKTWDVEYEGGSYKDYVKATAPTGRLRALLEGFRKNHQQEVQKHE